ncbi:UNVERIFIED_CONTAM: hypothetical protein HDU68_001209 [Siphonaria sp. JEL0065]|nr:hypothetical protein HDU68_001209 [Siphonaria sp. JEL0065]
MVPSLSKSNLNKPMTAAAIATKREKEGNVTEKKSSISVTGTIAKTSSRPPTASATKKGGSNPSLSVSDTTLRNTITDLQKSTAAKFCIECGIKQEGDWKSDSPIKYYVYNRETKIADFLFDARPVLANYQLNSMKASDGLSMRAYMTIPKRYEGSDGKYSSEPIPLIAHVHGGPYTRDVFGYQFFADRGYAVISPQFRGSTGFGKAFLAAANGEWAGKMHNDIIDACGWVVAKGIAIKDKIAIHGGSYGGYSALVGVTFTPEYFAASVDIVGPSNIGTLLDSIPAYWGPIRGMLTSSIVDQIVKPLLIGQGANDPRVKQAESDQIFDAMVQHKIPVTYVLYPDEGHGFARPPNNISFIAVTEAFLAKHLGGAAEEVGSAFEGSSIEFKGGREEIGLYYIIPFF